jgi:hypothetical protein
MPRKTPIKDFLFRLQVDPDFVNRVFGASFSTEPEPPEDLVALREAAFDEYELPQSARDAIVGKDFATLEQRVQEEDTDAHTTHILPKAWVA